MKIKDSFLPFLRAYLCQFQSGDQPQCPAELLHFLACPGDHIFHFNTISWLTVSDASNSNLPLLGIMDLQTNQLSFIN